MIFLFLSELRYVPGTSTKCWWQKTNKPLKYQRVLNCQISLQKEMRQWWLALDDMPFLNLKLYVEQISQGQHPSSTRPHSFKITWHTTGKGCTFENTKGEAKWCNVIPPGHQRAYRLISSTPYPACRIPVFQSPPGWHVFFLFFFWGGGGGAGIPN